MLYIHYAPVKIAGVIDGIELVISPSPQLRRGYFTKGELKTLVDIIKQVPASNRSYDPRSKRWTLTKDSFDAISKIAMALLYPKVQRIPYPDGSYLNPAKGTASNRTKIPTPEEFFRQDATPSISAKGQTKESMEKALRELMQTEEPLTRKTYLKACLTLHPDRNGGDGTKMSELNSLWSEYQKLYVWR